MSATPTIWAIKVPSSSGMAPLGQIAPQQHALPPTQRGDRRWTIARSVVEAVKCRRGWMRWPTKLVDLERFARAVRKTGRCDLVPTVARRLQGYKFNVAMLAPRTSSKHYLRSDDILAGLRFAHMSGVKRHRFRSAA
jgi:hypothetical protein